MAKALRVNTTLSPPSSDSCLRLFPGPHLARPCLPNVTYNSKNGNILPPQVKEFPHARTQSPKPPKPPQTPSIVSKRDPQIFKASPPDCLKLPLLFLPNVSTRQRRRGYFSTTKFKVPPSRHLYTFSTHPGLSYIKCQSQTPSQPTTPSNLVLKILLLLNGHSF